MVNIGEKTILNLAGNLNSGLSYLITTVQVDKFYINIRLDHSN